jgi:hypothetical protein
VSAFRFGFAAGFGGSGFSFVPISGSPDALGQIVASGAAQTDMLIDPVTLDYARTSTGEWAETADSRTLMMLMIELELAASPFDPRDGTTIATRRRDGSPITDDEVEAEALRIGELLQREGLIANFIATTTDAAGRPRRDSAGRLIVALSWRDLASGSPVDLAISG